MSFKTEKNLTGSFAIPAPTMTISGFTPGEDTDCHALNGAVAVLKKRMTAAELICAAWSLQQLSAELCAHLAERCGSGDCGECADEVKGCPYDANSLYRGKAQRSGFAAKRRRSGMSELSPSGGSEGYGACADVGPGLWDVPAPLMQGFLAAGICPGELEEKLKTGEIVYGT